MSLAIFLLHIVALVGHVNAQCEGPSTTIRSNDDVTAISNCGTYEGDIIIDSTASGQIALTGISHLKGDLTCANASRLTGVSFHQLVTISGTFSMQGLSSMSDLNFDSIMEVGEDLTLVDLPALKALDFATGIVTADQVTISGTGLRDLSGIDLATCSSLEVSHNTDLTTIGLKDLANTTNTITITDNGPGLAVDFQSLATSRGMLLQNVDSVNVPSLSTLTGTLALSLNTFRSFSAPKLTLAEDIVVTGNSLLSFLSFPSLPEINGGLTVANNTRLGSLSGFPVLQTITGSLNLTGSFSILDLPSLDRVQGNVNVETTIANTTICDRFNSAAGQNGVIGGSTTCTTGTDPPDPNAGAEQPPPTQTASSGGTSSTDSSSSGGGGGESISEITGAAIGGIVAGAIVLLVLITAAAWWWNRRRKTKGPKKIEELINPTPELPQGRHHETPELLGDGKYRYQKTQVYEMQDRKGGADHGKTFDVSELEGSNVPEMGGR